MRKRGKQKDKNWERKWDRITKREREKKTKSSKNTDAAGTVLEESDFFVCQDTSLVLEFPTSSLWDLDLTVNEALDERERKKERIDDDEEERKEEGSRWCSAQNIICFPKWSVFLFFPSSELGCCPRDFSLSLLLLSPFFSFFLPFHYYIEEKTPEMVNVKIMTNNNH